MDGGSAGGVGQGGVGPAARRLTDAIAVGVLTSSVPRDVLDEAIAAHGRQSRRSDGKLPPHVMVYFAMAMALFADDDYEEVLARLAEPLSQWNCWDRRWSMPGSSGITQARQRLGSTVVREVFEQVAQPVCELLTRGAWVAGRRLVSIDGCEFDVPDSPANADAFGYASGGAAGTGGAPGAGTGAGRSAFPKVRLVNLVETGSHAPIAAALGPIVGKGQGEVSLARELFDRLEPGMLLLADRNFYGWPGWCAAAGTGADLLWRLSTGGSCDITPPIVQTLPDGSYLTVLYASRMRQPERDRILTAARAGAALDPARARIARIIDYQITHPTDTPTGAPAETIRLLTTLLDPHEAPAAVLAQAYHQRWEHEASNNQLKTHLRGPGRVLRSKSPDMIRQEIYGYLLTHYALAALICHAATEADIDPDRIKFRRTLHIVRRRIDDPAAFSP
jgi:hypothetical protein